MHAAHVAGIDLCRVVTGDPWRPRQETLDEISRLAPDMIVAFAPPPNGANAAQTVVISGDRLPGPQAIMDTLAGRTVPGVVRVDGAANDVAGLIRLSGVGDGQSLPRLASRAAEILAQTGKPTDGVISRSLNRPISRTISWLALKLPGLRPIHATIGTALLAAAMFGFLVLGGSSGLVIGAIMFQVASIFDGVDGEVARATFRASRQGALLDSMIDAATNIAFLLGVSINLWVGGDPASAALGALGLIIVALGLALIARNATPDNASFSFDWVKDYYRGANGGNGDASLTARALVFVTSRDFFAFAFAVTIGIGHANYALAVFLLFATGWLVAVVIALSARQAAQGVD